MSATATGSRPRPSGSGTANLRFNYERRIESNNVPTTEPNAVKSATFTCSPLTDYITCYDNATFTVNILNKSCEHRLELEFTAFNRTFNLVLASAYTPAVVSHHLNIQLVDADRSSRDGHINYMFDDYFSGFVKGEPSRFNGRYMNGILDGILEVEEDTYYLEPVANYFKEIGNFSSKNRLVAYRERDLAVSARRPIQHGTSPIPTESDGKLQHVHRHKREFVSTYKVCELKVIVDFNFFNIYCAKSVTRAVDEVVHAVTLSDTVFRNIDFDSNGVSDNLGFVIKEIVIFENDTSPDYYLTQSTVAKDVLMGLSRYNLSNYCLGVLMTYRDLEDDVIGLAWTASSSKLGQPGGVCQKRLYSYKTSRSFNSLLLSPLNAGTVLPRRMFALTMAHELGHSFGSHHDDSTDELCSPGGVYGTYLMSEIASQYLKPDNNAFSPCSILAMGPVVANKMSCLKTYDIHSLCGNYLIDPGEECDCGPTVDGCEVFDPCCEAPSLGHNGCRVPRELDRHCSPRASPCCTRDCNVETTPAVCRTSTECSHESRCDTMSVECPDSLPRDDGTLCRGGTRVCRRGVCSVSRCVHHGWEDCQCNKVEEEFCELCCKPANASQAWCQPAYRITSDDNIVGRIYRRSRELCEDNTGFCNKQHYCTILRPRDYDDVFQLIFQPSMGEELRTFVKNHWYFVIIGFAFLTFTVQLLCALYPRKEPLAVLALKTAKMATLWRMIDVECVTLDDQLQRLYLSYEMKMDDLEEGEPVDMVVGVSRMINLFPTAPQFVVVEAVSNGGSESFAVRILLMKGYPLKKQTCVDEVMPRQTRRKEAMEPGSRPFDVTSLTPVEHPSTVDTYITCDSPTKPGSSSSCFLL